MPMDEEEKNNKKKEKTDVLIFSLLNIFHEYKKVKKDV